MAYTFDTPITTSDQSLDRVLAAGLPVALVFLNGSAPLALEEAMNRLARENAGQLLVVRTDVKDSPEAARRYQVQMTPAVVTVRDGQILTQASSITGSDLEKHIAYLLGKGPKPEIPRPATAAEGRRPSGKPLVVTDATFDREVLRASEPVLVDFWAPWCGPCRMTEPIVEKLAGELSGRLRVAKVNVDENPGIAARYNVQGIPTMLIVKNGQVIDRWSGALPEPAMRSRVAQSPTT
jgi:thioredoxin 1